jgi:hypothetical protein
MISGCTHVFKIKNNGDVSCTGNLTVGGTVAPDQKYGYIGGLRIAEWDYGNTLYQSIVNYDIGISTNISRTSGGNIKFYTRAVTRMVIDGASGSVGIGNLSPWAPLNIGIVDSVSNGYINFSKNTGIGTWRNCRVGYSGGFGFSTGDNGNVNNNTNSWNVQFTIAYNAPFASLGVNEVG